MDWSLIKDCADICRASYQDNSPGFTVVEDLCYGVCESGGMTIIAIRGTANTENWLRDADAIPVRSCGGHLAHKGFVQAYRALCSGGMPTVKGRANVIATGHSLGGAIATLLAEHIGCKLITFGSPRVYARFFSAPVLDHIRVICDDDPVPMVPRILYRHTCYPITLKDHDGEFINVKDHVIAHYINMINVNEGR